MNAEKIKKINGFSRGLNIYQYLSYLIMIAQIFTYSYIIVPNLNISWQVPLTSSFYLAFIVTFFFGSKVTLSDPTDEIVITERKNKREGAAYDSTIFDYHCQYCDSSVSDRSKHCRQCNRCVQDFDHHCKWVNNCVARINYKDFMIMICAVLGSTFLYSLAGTLYTVDFYMKGVGFIKTDNLDTMREHTNEYVKTIVLIVLTALNLTLFILDSKLVMFHIYLIRSKQTTYDYILKLKEKPSIDGIKKGSKNKKKKKSNKVLPEESDNPIIIANTHELSPVSVGVDSQTQSSNQKIVKKIERKLFPDTPKDEKIDGPDENLLNMLANGGCSDVEVDQNTFIRTNSNSSSHKTTIHVDPTSPSAQSLLQKKVYVGKLRNSDEKTDVGDTAIISRTTIRLSNQDSIQPLQKESQDVLENLQKDSQDMGNRTMDSTSPYKSYGNKLFNNFTPEDNEHEHDHEHEPEVNGIRLPTDNTDAA